MKHWLIIYDIRDTKRLAKVAKILESYAVRVQYSVFEAITEKEMIEIIRERVNRIIEDEDFVVYFELCNSDWQKQIKYGPAKYEIYEDKSFHIL